VSEVFYDAVGICYQWQRRRSETHSKEI